MSEDVEEAGIFIRNRRFRYRSTHIGLLFDTSQPPRGSGGRDRLYIYIYKVYILFLNEYLSLNHSFTSR